MKVKKNFLSLQMKLVVVAMALLLVCASESHADEDIQVTPDKYRTLFSCCDDGTKQTLFRDQSIIEEIRQHMSASRVARQQLLLTYQTQLVKIRESEEMCRCKV